MLNAWTKYNGCYTFTSASGDVFSICPYKELVDAGYETKFTVFFNVAEFGHFETLEKAKKSCEESLMVEDDITFSKVQIDVEKVKKPVKTIVYHNYYAIPKDFLA